MSKKLCVCLTESEQQDCIDFVSRSDADFIEHRLDFMKQIGNLNQIYSVTSIPIIATCRSPEEGGRFQGDKQERISHLLEAIKGGASFVDIEIESEENDLKQVYRAARANECKLIVSKHYFDRTPDTSELLDMMERITNTPVDIVKIITTPKSIDESKRTLQLYELNETEIPLIAFGMGSVGKFTRVSALYLGAPFMYVSQDIGEKAAPGQISLSDMRKLVEAIP